jgi:hypothetical protein
MNEYIYILSNPSMRGLIKVGKTTTHPSQRMSELHSTGVPTPFELEFSAMVMDCQYSETAAHRALSRYRVSDNREFFKVSVKKALELILPEIGEYRIHDFNEMHDIEPIRREADRRAQEKREAETRQLAAERQEAERQETEQLAKRRAIEQKIAAEENKLRQLGQRPVRKELPSIGSFLATCYCPLPMGWIIWAGAGGVFNLRYQTSGFVCIALIVAGYIFNEIDNKNRAAFDIINAPFREIDDALSRLREELAKLPRLTPARETKNMRSTLPSAVANSIIPSPPGPFKVDHAALRDSVATVEYIVRPSEPLPPLATVHEAESFSPQNTLKAPEVNAQTPNIDHFAHTRAKATVEYIGKPPAAAQKAERNSGDQLMYYVCHYCGRKSIQHHKQIFTCDYCRNSI